MEFTFFLRHTSSKGSSIPTATNEAYDVMKCSIATTTNEAYDVMKCSIATTTNEAYGVTKCSIATTTNEAYGVMQLEQMDKHVYDMIDVSGGTNPGVAKEGKEEAVYATIQEDQ